MGKPTEKVPSRGAHLAPVPNSLDSTPNVSIGTTSHAPPVSEASTPSAPYERHIHRNGRLGHPTRSEVTTHASDWVSTTFQPLSPLSRVADIPHQASGVPPPPHRGPVIDVISSQIQRPTPQDSALVSSLLAPVSNDPTEPFSTSTQGPFPNPGARPNPDTQTRPKLPRVKTCLLCAGGRDLRVLQDTGLIIQALDRVRKIDSEHLIMRTSKMIDVAFDKFFDPNDIRKGGLLILIISGHGKREYGGVSLQFQTQDGTVVNSSMLREKISALPEHCTLEIVGDICFAEGLIPGLRRISTMEPSAPSGISGSGTTDTPLSVSHFSTKAPAPPTAFNVGSSASSFLEQNEQPKYKAQVVFWAASTKWGASYPEADLPGKPGVYSIMIGAIFHYLNSNGPNTTRRDIWENVCKVVEEQNDARRERDLRKSPKVQANLTRERRIQRPILLMSVEDSDHVLNGLVFRPIKKV